MCRCYQQLQQTDMALVLVQGIVRENRDNLEAMLEYAKLTFDLGDLQASESAVIMLTCLVAEKSKFVQKSCKTHSKAIFVFINRF